MYWSNALSRASCARQSKPSRQYSTSACTYARFDPYRQSEPGDLIGPPRALQAGAQVGEHLLGDGESERLGRRGSHVVLVAAAGA